RIPANEDKIINPTARYRGFFPRKRISPSNIKIGSASKPVRVCADRNTANMPQVTMIFRMASDFVHVVSRHLMEYVVIAPRRSIKLVNETMISADVDGLLEE